MAEPKPSTSTISLIGLFAVWYAFNAGYNVYNSKLKGDLPLPLAISISQLLVGLLYALPLWITGMRKAPNLTWKDLVRIFPVAALNAIGHATTVVATFQKGGGSFTHVIKASEPVVSTILALFINGVVPPPLTGLSLLPITYGVAYASTLGNLSPASMAKELTTKAAAFAMTGNVCFALRSIVRKNLSSEFKARTNLTPANDHAVTTIFSALLLLPVLYFVEGPEVVKSAYERISDKNAFLLNMFVCGMCFYIYNEVRQATPWLLFVSIYSLVSLTLSTVHHSHH